MQSIISTRFVYLRILLGVKLQAAASQRVVSGYKINDGDGGCGGWTD